MQTQFLLAHFGKDVLFAHTPLPALSLEDGVRLMSIVPVRAGGCVFLGDYSAWLLLCKKKKLYPGSSYLVCLDKESLPQQPVIHDKTINVIFLHIPMDMAIRRLDSLHHNSTVNHSTGEETLISFFQLISEQNFCSKEAAATWISRFPFPLKPYFACLVLRPQAGLIRADLSVPTVTEALHTFFPETNLFFYQNEWIIFYSQDSVASDEINISYSAFSKLLGEYGLNAGISYVGMLPENIYTLYLTAAASVELGTQISIPPQVRHIYTFAQYHPLYLIHLSAQEFDRLHHQRSFYYMAHPDIIRIFTYDQAHKTDLLDVLYAYMLNDSSLSHAARYLYVHRNTVYNKLTKIESLLGYKLSRIHDHSIFTISYMVVKYYCEYQGRDFQ